MHALISYRATKNYERTEMEEVRLYKTWSSPFGVRIVWALKLKGIPYVAIDENLSNKSPSFLHYNPIYKKIPVLVHNGKPIVESLVILEYIEDTWKQIPILFDDPYQKATARFLAKYGDDKLIPSVWAVLTAKQGEEQKQAIVTATENLTYLEKELAGKKYFGGDSIGLADISFGWIVNLIPVLEELLGFKLIEERKFPLLSAWKQELSNVPVIKESLPPHDKMITKFQAYLPVTPQT